MLRYIPVLMMAVLLLFSFNSTLQCQEIVAARRRVLSRANPQYPATAMQFHLGGTVKAEAIVAPNGIVKSVRVKGGHPLLAAAAENAIRQWKWETTSRETEETVEVRFKPE
jgi:TonB family protein